MTMVTKKQTKDKQIKELTELVQRTQANFENYRKQTEKRIDEIKEQAAKEIITQLLPIVDNFDLALKNKVDIDNIEEFINGIKLIKSLLDKLLKENAVKTINTRGEFFDPYFHEALMKVEADLPENKIIEELQRGFTLQGKVIRHAKVKISAGKTQEEK